MADYYTTFSFLAGALRATDARFLLNLQDALIATAMTDCPADEASDDALAATLLANLQRCAAPEHLPTQESFTGALQCLRPWLTNASGRRRAMSNAEWVGDLAGFPDIVIQGQDAWVCSAEGGVCISTVVFLMRLWLLTAEEPPRYVGFEWAHHCSRLIDDGFGGGAVLVTAASETWMNTAAWLDEEIGRAKNATAALQP
ncbi:MAG: hypothetical protein E6Q40_02160 [Cupriavidus sp.]|nr:MAG: hypothetical protein E6Q40_02160 [Cupriavidus sp.]